MLGPTCARRALGIKGDHRGARRGATGAVDRDRSDLAREPAHDRHPHDLALHDEGALRAGLGDREDVEEALMLGRHDAVEVGRRAPHLDPDAEMPARGAQHVVDPHLRHPQRADPAVPLYGFVFLVALGVDYNIFLMSRVREESLRHGTRPGILRGLVATGGVITSAGLVLAATFAALGVIPILFLAQLAFIVAFGVLLDALIVRSLLVPALTYDIGQKIWWPSKLASTPEPEQDQPAPSQPQSSLH